MGNGTWTRTASGGLWSDNENWQEGIVGSGSGNTATFNILELVDDTTVHLDAPRTVGNLVFGDTDPGSPGSWIVDDAGNPGNVLTLAVPSGSPSITVLPMGAGAGATLDLPLAGASGLTKLGLGSLVLKKANPLSAAPSTSTAASCAWTRAAA